MGGDTKVLALKSVIDNDETLTKKCLSVKKEMTLDSKYYTSLIENNENFESGDNIAKTTKKLDENNEKLTRVRHQLCTSLIKRELKAKQECTNEVIQATNQYVNSLFEAIKFPVSENISAIEKPACYNSEQNLPCSGKQLCPELNLRDDMSIFLTHSRDGPITEKISYLSNSVVNLVEVKAKFPDDFASNQTEATEACSSVEHFNDKTENNIELNKDVSFYAESKNKTYLNKVCFRKVEGKTDTFSNYDENFEKSTMVETSSIKSSINKNAEVENENINENIQTTNKYIEISFDCQIERLFQGDINFECSAKTTAHYKSQPSTHRRKTIFSKFLKLKKIRSNQVSPADMEPEVQSKSKVRKFASNFTNGVRKSFGNLRQACRSKRSPLVFCSVPFYFHR